jgi:hypothetical protein
MLVVDLFELVDLLDELFVDHPEHLAIELLHPNDRREVRRRPQNLLDNPRYLPWFARLDQDVRHAAGFCERPDVALVESRRTEDNGRVPDQLVRAQGARELVAVHLRHDQIGDDQRGPVPARELEGLLARRRLEHLEAGVPKDRRDQIPIGGCVVEYERRPHRDSPVLCKRMRVQGRGYCSIRQANISGFELRACGRSGPSSRVDPGGHGSERRGVRSPPRGGDQRVRDFDTHRDRARVYAKRLRLA